MSNGLQGIAVDFNVPAKDLSQIQARVQKPGLPLQVVVHGSDTHKTYQGTTLFLHPEVDKHSGTVGIRGS